MVKFELNLNPIKDRGNRAKIPPTGFFPPTSINVKISLQNSITFKIKTFLKFLKLFSFKKAISSQFC